ncbi:uncharacterized protein AAGF69_007805 [Amazona ochrocephala]
MAAPPLNNLREQLRRHSARGALSAPPPRHRPAGFTFKKTSPAGGPARAPRALPAAALRDKDVNTSLPALAQAGRSTHIPGLLPAAHGRGRELAGAGPRSASTGAAVRSVPEGSPVIIVEDEWDDIDDFDLSGIEKRRCRRPVLSPRGQRGPAEAPPGAEPEPSSPQSLICLEDAAPCGSEDRWEDAPVEGALDDGGREAPPAPAGTSGGSQKPSSDENSPPELDEAELVALTGAELGEDDDLDVIPPSPEEELPDLSPSVKSIR